MTRMTVGLRAVAGMTMVEVMIVIAIIGLLISIAVPNYLDWNRKYQLKEAVGTLQAFIGLSRMNAVNRNATVTVTVCQTTPCPGALVNPTPAQVTVFFRNAAGADIIPAMTMVPGLSLTNAGGGVVTSPQDVQITAMGRPVPFSSTPGGANNLCVDATGAGVACNTPQATAQALNFMNSDGVNYRIVITSTGKAAWGYSATLAP